MADDIDTGEPCAWILQISDGNVRCAMTTTIVQAQAREIALRGLRGSVENLPFPLTLTLAHAKHHSVNNSRFLRFESKARTCDTRRRRV